MIAISFEAVLVEAQMCQMYMAPKFVSEKPFLIYTSHWHHLCTAHTEPITKVGSTYMHISYKHTSPICVTCV